MTSSSPRAEPEPLAPERGLESAGDDPRGPEAAEPRRLSERMADRVPAPRPVARALVLGTLIGLLIAILAGLVRLWVWVLGLEPVALGLVLGEASASPSTSRHRRPPTWSYGYVLALGCLAYLVIHVVFWLASQGFWPSTSFLAFLQAAPSATAAPLFQEVDLARQIALATGGTTQLKYWLWVCEGSAMGLSALLAYRGGSVRKLRT